MDGSTPRAERITSAGTASARNATPRSWRGPATRATAIFLLGFACLVVTPPFQTPDSGNHLGRAFQISQGILIAEQRGQQTGGLVPQALVADIGQYGDLPFQPEHRISFQVWRDRLRASGHLTNDASVPLVFMNFPNTSRYLPVPYLPQALGQLVARSLRAPDLIAIYLSGLFALISSSLLLLAAFRALDFSSRMTTICFLVAGMPMSAFLLGSISPDGQTLALALLAFALAHRVQHKPDARTLAALVVVSSLLGACKGLYCIVPLGLLPVALSGLVRRGERVAASLFAACVAACAILPTLIWSLLTRGQYNALNPDPRIDPSEQIHFLLTHPITGFVLLARDFLSRAPNLVHSMIGVLGWLDTPLPHWLVILYAGGMTLLVLFAAEGKGSSTALSIRVWMAGSCLAFAFAMSLISYLTWTPVGANAVEGLQGRYYLPIMPLLLSAAPVMVSPVQRWVRAREAAPILLWLISSSTLMVNLLHRYWQR